MKKILTIVLVVCMIIGLSACGKKKEVDPNLMVIGDYQALYTGSEITQDYYGDDAIIISYVYTNNSKEDASFDWSMFYTVMQNGEELGYTSIFVDDDSFDTIDEDNSTEIAPGQSQVVKLTYNLLDLENPVTVKFSDLFDKKTAEHTIDLSTAKVIVADNGSDADDDIDTDDGDDDGFIVDVDPDGDDDDDDIDVDDYDESDVPEEIEIPSEWYGVASFTNCVGFEEAETVFDVSGIIDIDAESGRPYFELYPVDGDGSAIVSMYIDPEETVWLSPVIGEQDAWILDKYLTEDDEWDLLTLYYDGTLDISYTYDDGEGATAECQFYVKHINALWDEFDPFIPSGYAN